MKNGFAMFFLLLTRHTEFISS